MTTILDRTTPQEAVKLSKRGHSNEQLAPTPASATRPRRSRPVPNSSANDQMQCELLPQERFPEWDSLVDQSQHGTVFHYSWWLKTTAEHLDILVVRDKNGLLLGGLPLPQKCRLGLRLFHSPPLTPYLGPIFDLSCANSKADRLYLMRTYGEMLARNISSFDSCRYMAGADAPDLQGFLWAGFRVHLAYTFRFNADMSIGEVTAGITRTHMQKVKRARQMELRVTQERDVTELVRLNKHVFERQAVPRPYSDGLIGRIWEAGNSHGRARIYVARMSNGVPSAALMTVHDNRTTYQILSGTNPDLRDIPGGYLVLWSALEDTLAAGRNFDFEGSGLRGVERFYRRWGPAAMPVWRIEKSGSIRGAALQVLLRRHDQTVFNWESA